MSANIATFVAKLESALPLALPGASKVSVHLANESPRTLNHNARLDHRE